MSKPPCPLRIWGRSIAVLRKMGIRVSRCIESSNILVSKKHLLPLCTGLVTKQNMGTGSKYALCAGAVLLDSCIGLGG